jgi:hypothetical protein
MVATRPATVTAAAIISNGAADLNVAADRTTGTTAGVDVEAGSAAGGADATAIAISSGTIVTVTATATAGRVCRAFTTQAGTSPSWI